MKAVLFDLDGTLLDRETSIRSFIDDQYDRLSSFFPHVSKQAFMTRFITLECHGYVWKDQVYQQLVEEFSIKTLHGNSFLTIIKLVFIVIALPFLT